jgi:endonuclease YncB( thermonuclease family)
VGRTPSRSTLRSCAGGVLLLLFGAGAAAQEIAGSARVIDGDTLEIDLRPVHLYGIDAVESGQTCVSGQWTAYDCGAMAARALAALVESQRVVCRPRDRDRYGWPFAVCRVPGPKPGTGMDVAAELVRQGWAVALPRDATLYAGIEDDARRRRRGLWNGRFVPPWDWRALARDGEPR